MIETEEATHLSDIFSTVENSLASAWYGTLDIKNPFANPTPLLVSRSLPLWDHTLQWFQTWKFLCSDFFWQMAGFSPRSIQTSKPDKYC